MTADAPAFLRRAACAPRDPIDRARHWRNLAETLKPVLAAAGDAAIVEALRAGTYAEVAAALGVSTAAVNKAVTRHQDAAIVDALRAGSPAEVAARLGVSEESVGRAVARHEGRRYVARLKPERDTAPADVPETAGCDA